MKSNGEFLFFNDKIIKLSEISCIYINEFQSTNYTRKQEILIRLKNDFEMRIYEQEEDDYQGDLIKEIFKTFSDFIYNLNKPKD